MRAAVAWIDDAVRREPRRADLGLRALAAIFAIDTLMIQERAVRVAARLAARAGDEGRTAIMEAAGGLPAELREKIATAYGETVAARDTGPAPVLVAPPGPALPPPVASPEELVRRLSAVADPLPVAEFECLLAGLAEWAHREPGTLRELLLSWWQPLNPGFFGYVGYATYETLLTLFRRVVLAFASPPDSRSLSATIKTEQVYWHGRNVLDEFYRDRAHELIAHFEDERAYPALLAAPTSATGSIDPAVLLDRIERLDAAGVEALPADLAQALLRLDPEAGEPVAERAEKTSGEAGRALAAWVRGGGLPDRRARCEVRHHKRYYSDYQEIEIAFDPPVEGPFRKLFTPTSSYADTMEFWPLVLPAHREVVAAHALAALQLHVSGSGTDQAAVLVSLAHADGPIGRAMACALACAMGFEAASGRAAAADALLVLAARGQVPAAELARAVTDLVTGEFVKLSRVIGVLDDVTGAGGHEAVWAIVAELLPALLPGPGERPRNGLADLLAAGARAAAPAAAKAVIPELAAVAARKGSSRLAQEARRLQALLTG
ncbi:DUF7824 domain-containing protein [Thermocatellispora tengchongensis]|uniref:DUF7824 domain-containing protein n=1 Tax=Thermocatellispora tengchongensis TaxID=1073253 RepID=UPI00362F528A